jgi:hypothetical protein
MFFSFPLSLSHFPPASATSLRFPRFETLISLRLDWTQLPHYAYSRVLYFFTRSMLKGEKVR